MLTGSHLCLRFAGNLFPFCFHFLFSFFLFFCLFVCFVFLKFIFVSLTIICTSNNIEASLSRCSQLFSFRCYTYHFQYSSSLSGLPVLTKVPPSPATPMQRSIFQAVCQAEGFPRPVISWRRVGMPFPGGRTEVNHGTLTIKNLILADSGLYDCIATNAMGTKKTRINLVVQRKLGKLYIFSTKRFVSSANQS